VGASLPAASGLEDAVRPAAELLAAAYPPPPVTPWPVGEYRREVQQAVVAQLPALLPLGGITENAARLAFELARLDDRPPVPTKIAAPSTDITLGDDTNYFLKVWLTPEGASVRQVILNRFPMADAYGLPVTDPMTKAPRPLDLVPPWRIKERSELENAQRNTIEFDQTDPFHHYQLYHYVRADDDRPVDSLGKLNWTLVPPGVQTKDGRQEVSFQAEIDGSIRVTKTYALAPGDYHLGLTVKMESLRQSGEATKFRYQLAGARGLPVEGEWYTQIFRNALIGWEHQSGGFGRSFEDSRSLSLKMGGEEVRRGSDKVKAIRYAGIAVQFFASAIVVDDQQENKDFIEWARPTLEQAVMNGLVVAPAEALEKGLVKKVDADELLVSANDKLHVFRLKRALHLALAAAPLAPKTPVSVLWTREGDQFVAVKILRQSQAVAPLLDDPTVRVMSEVVTLEPGKPVEHKYLLYNGPVKVRLLGYLQGKDAVNPELVTRYEHTLHLNTLTDYGGWGFWTDLIIFFTNLMHGLLAFLHTYVWPWSAGVCIILLTVLVRGAMFPISRRQARNSKDMQEKMQRVQPEMKKLKEKYKEDPWALYQAQQELFKRQNINQFAMLGGCLPLFAQLPIFMGLYYCLQESILFRLEPFLYIRNLAAPDMLLWWGERIPVISEISNQGGMLYLGPYLNLLPLIAVVLMMVHQAVMTPPAMDEQQEMNMKMMKWMSVVFGIMFYKVAAGLTLYFIVSSLWGLAERKLLPKAKTPPAGGTDETAPAPEVETPRVEPPKRSRPEPKKKSTGGDGIVQKLKDWWQSLLEEAAKQQQARREPRDEDDDRKPKRRDDRAGRRKGRD
jgi:YidC/Oxa1 family membrane protein insertase